MRNEVYISWFCEKFSSPMRVSLKGICYCSASGFEIHVCEEGKPNEEISIRFKELPVATRITNESQRLISLNSVPQGFIHFINIVKESSFIEWLNHDSLDIYRNDNWLHFVIIADDEWIDIVSVDYPEISSPLKILDASRGIEGQ